MTVAYQSFDDRPGASKSADKLAALRMPKDLTGKRVLDLGCNQGYFSLEAKRRGAAEVIGIDANRAHIPLAKERAQAEGLEVDFRHGNMLDLAEGMFDLVLSLSAIYYLDSPAELLRRVREKLTPDGLLILELGVDRSRGEMTAVRALRSRDERCFPTERLLREVWLDGYSTRLIGASVPQAGDPIPRIVYHCTKALTNVILIGGEGRSGKSTLAMQLSPNHPIVSVDHLLKPRRASNASIVPAQAIIDKAFDKDKSIRRTWLEIGQNTDVRTHVAKAVASAVRQCCPSDVVVVEGYVVADLATEIKAALGADFRSWDVRRS
jgi:SAM-dependent methyltransferase